MRDARARMFARSLLSLLLSLYLTRAAQPRRAYMAQSQVFEGEAARDLRADFSAPYLIADRAFSTSLYLGPRHTITPLHCDPGHTLLAQVFGRKVVHVVPAAQRALVYPFSELYRRHVSMVDPERPDLAAFPDFLRADVGLGAAVVGARLSLILSRSRARTHAQVFKDTLMPGELLYLPARWWHHVRSLDPACSLSFMWFEPKSESERAAHAAVVAAAAAAP
jgi:lysine-specific demethylase 8